MNIPPWQQFVGRLNLSLVAKLEILLYGVVAFVHLKYLLFTGFRVHGFWSWHTVKSLVYVAISVYMIRFCQRFLRKI